MPSPASIQVLMAAYNNQAYIAQQVQSILDQTHPGLEILVRDDASTDRTPAIIHDLAARHPSRIHILPGPAKNLGVLGSYAQLIAHARPTPAYIMFSDADDVWLPEKAALTLAKMRELEAQAGPQTPLLVHTDARVVDRDLHPIADSFLRYQFIDPTHGTTLNRLLVQNAVTGCTMMINASLLELIKPATAPGGALSGELPRALPGELPGAGAGAKLAAWACPARTPVLPEAHPESLPGAIMHDWWIALTAAALGRIAYVPQATLLYRQHGGNFTGAKAWGPRTMARAAWSFVRDDSMKKSLARAQAQAAALLAALGPRLPEPQRNLIAAYASFPQRSYLERRRLMFRHRLFKTGLTRNLGMLAAL